MRMNLALARRIKTNDPPANRRSMYFVIIRVVGVSLLLSSALVHAQTQAAMNAQARADFQRADGELNKTYQIVLAKLPIAEKQKLKEAQRAWVASRDADPVRAAKDAEGASMAPSIRYETITDLTRKRITELKAMIDKGTMISPPTQAAQSPNAQASSGSKSEPAPDSFSPDKEWEYTCEEYGIGQCAPEIVNATTSDIVLDFDEEVHGPEASAARVVWAPNSKRFAFNYSPPHAHYAQYATVAFYQLEGDKWVQLAAPLSLIDESQLLQLGKKHLLKDFNPRRCAAERDVVKLRNWIDANTAILYAPCYGRTSNELEAAFLFTLKFDPSGKCKFVETHQMSKKELEEEEK